MRAGAGGVCWSVGCREAPLLAAALGELGGAVCAAGLSWDGGAGLRGGSGAAEEGGGMRGMEGQSETCSGAKPGPRAGSGAGRAQIPCGAPSLPPARAEQGNAARGGAGWLRSPEGRSHGTDAGLSPECA